MPKRINTAAAEIAKIADTASAAKTYTVSVDPAARENYTDLCALPIDHSGGAEEYSADISDEVFLPDFEAIVQSIKFE